MKPKKQLEYYSKQYPAAWKQVDQIRASRGKTVPFWPDWCFLTLTGAYAIVEAEASKQGIDILSCAGWPLINDVGIIGALAAWRVTQGVYRFDPDVYQAIINTSITGDMPHDVLFNIPEWCVYIETPGLNIGGKVLAGFFAYLQCNENDNHNELRLVVDYDIPIPSLHSVPIHLGQWPLAKTASEAAKQADILGIDYILPAADQMQADYTPLVSLVLYLCSVNGEIGADGQRPTRPSVKKTKNGPRLFPPMQPKTWDVGVRMGTAMRKAAETSSELAATRNELSKQRSSPRAHYRRAHWQGYWTGPRTGEQKYIVKWIPPLLIGDSDSMPVTIRPVK